MKQNLFETCNSRLPHSIDCLHLTLFARGRPGGGGGRAEAGVMEAEAVAGDMLAEGGGGGRRCPFLVAAGGGGGAHVGGGGGGVHSGGGGAKTSAVGLSILGGGLPQHMSARRRRSHSPRVQPATSLAAHPGVGNWLRVVSGVVPVRKASARIQDFQSNAAFQGRTSHRAVPAAVKPARECQIEAFCRQFGERQQSNFQLRPQFLPPILL